MILGEVVVFGEAVDVFVYQVCVHQAEGGVGIRDFYSEDQAKEKADCVFYEFSGFSVTADFAVSDDGIVGVSFFPEGFKFVGVGLAVGVGLEDYSQLCVQWRSGNRRELWNRGRRLAWSGGLGEGGPVPVCKLAHKYYLCFHR